MESETASPTEKKKKSENQIKKLSENFFYIFFSYILLIPSFRTRATAKQPGEVGCRVFSEGRGETWSWGGVIFQPHWIASDRTTIFLLISAKEIYFSLFPLLSISSGLTLVSLFFRNIFHFFISFFRALKNRNR